MRNSGCDSRLTTGPWYLVRQGRVDDAKRSLRRLARAGHYTESRLDQEIALMQHTNEMEMAEMEGAGYRECFRGTNLRRTEIVRTSSLGMCSPTVVCHLDHSILLWTTDLWVCYPIVSLLSLYIAKLTPTAFKPRVCRPSLVSIFSFPSTACTSWGPHGEC